MSEKIDWDKPIETWYGEPAKYLGMCEPPVSGTFTRAVQYRGCDEGRWLIDAVGDDGRGRNDGAGGPFIRNVREPGYRPYTPDELAALVGTAVRCNSTGDECVLACHCTTSQRVYIWWKFDIEERSNSELLSGYTHLDGTPCGVLVEDDDESQ